MKRTPVATRLISGLLLLLAFAVPAVVGCSDDGSDATSSSAVTATSAAPTSTANSAVTSSTTTATTDTQPSTTPTTGAGGASSRTTVTYADPATTDTNVPGMSGPLAESNALARELKSTLEAANDLVGEYEKAGSKPDDPTAGRVYALRALGQALTARRAIVDNQPPLADAAVRQCVKLLSVAKPLDEETEAAVTRAKAVLAEAPAPSQAPETAASYLDEVIVALRPLVPAGRPI